MDFIDPDGDGSGKELGLAKRYLHGQAVDQLLAQEDLTTTTSGTVPFDLTTAGSVAWPLTDNLGSTRSLVDSDGNITDTCSYDAFGVIATVVAGSLGSTRYMYTGQKRDPSTGTYYIAKPNATNDATRRPDMPTSPICRQVNRSRNTPERSVVSRRGRRLGLDEHHVGLRHPAGPQVEAEPPFAVLLVETGPRPRTELCQVVLSPGLAHVGGNDHSVLHGRGRRAVGGQHHAVLDDHVARLHARIEQLRVLFRIGDVGRVAAKDAAIVGLGAIRIADPVALAVDETDSAALVARVEAGGDDYLPLPAVLRRLVGPAEPVALLALRAVAVAGAGVVAVQE